MSTSTLIKEKSSTSDLPREQPRKRVFFYCLNQLRFWPCLAIMVIHVEWYKSMCGRPHIGLDQLLPFAHQCLSFFFVLSGFLITYLLVSERMLTGALDIKKFYIRRILRVWPLYFLIVGISFFLVPSFLNLDSSISPYLARAQEKFITTRFWNDLLCFVFMVPNVPAAQLHNVIGASQSWSVGVEEQFYLMWPVLFSVFQQHPVLMMLSAMVAKFALISGIESPAVQGFAHFGPHCKFLVDSAYRFISAFDLEGLALGGLAAYLLLKYPRSSFVRLLQHRFGGFVALSPLLLIPFLPARAVNHWILAFDQGDFVLALGYAALCINLARFGDKPKSKLGKVSNYLGTITYGLYMYNMLAIAIVLKALANFSLQPIAYDVLLYGLSMALTLVLSVLSYELWESRFLKQKSRFAIISTDQQ